MQIQVDRNDVIVAVGFFPSGSPDPSIRILDLTPAQDVRLSEALRTPGIKTIGADGTITVAAPVPPPLVFSSEQIITSKLRTSDATTTELYRVTLQPLTGYAATFDLIAVDSGNGAVRRIQAAVTAKRLNAGAVLVGAPTVIVSHADAGATTWTVSASVVGNDFVVSVTGAAGRTVDWALRGTVQAFAPAGLT